MYIYAGIAFVAVTLGIHEKYNIISVYVCVCILLFILGGKKQLYQGTLIFSYHYYKCKSKIQNRKKLK